MKIAFIIYGSLDTISGGYLYDRHLVGRMRERGLTVDIVSLPWRNYARHLLDNLNLRFARRIARGGYDLIIQDELNHPSLFALNHYLKASTRRPIVSVVHHLRSSEQHPRLLCPVYRAIERHYLRTIDGFIFNSQTTQTTVTQLLRRPAPHVIARPGSNPGEGLPLEAVAARAAQDRSLQVLFVGNLIPRKGLHTLIDAFGTMPAGSAHLTAIGSLQAAPAYAASIRRKIEQKQLQNRVQLLGSVSDEVLRQHLAAADLLAVPSQYEGFGIVYLEGMAFGLPAIGTTAGAAGEVIQDHQSGFLIEPGDAAGLAAILTALANDRAQLRRMCIAAREAYDRFPLWAASMDKAISFLIDNYSLSQRSFHSG